MHGHHWEIAANGSSATRGRTRHCPICGEPHLTVIITSAQPSGGVHVAPVGTSGGPSVAIPGCELLGELGRGGMGVVYKARQAEANRFVAVKMILAGAYAGPAQLQRFRTEAEAAARLHHPNIVQLYEVGEQDGRPYCLLEYISGSSLAHQLDGTPWPARQAAELVRVLAEAIHVAHRLGIVHRDLKPGNVLLTEDGVPKITDFGLAKLLDHTTGPTQSGDLLGTPCYIAPEQADRQSRPITPAVDVYALGAILYELLTGRPPFKGETPLDTILQVVHDDPVPVSRLQPKVPRELNTICMKCLEKEPQRRYDSAAALADELQRFLHHQPIRARPLGRVALLARWCRRNPPLAVTGGLAVALLLATVVLSVWFAFHQSLVAERLRGALEAQRFSQTLRDFTLGRNLCEDGEPVTGLLWMGRSLEQGPLGEPAFQQTLRMNLRSWGQTLHPLRNVQTAPSGVSHAAFSADGQTLATAGWGAAVWTWNATTEQWQARTLLEAGIVDALVLSANGRIAATVREQSTVEIWNVADGKRQRQVLPHDAGVLMLTLSTTGRLLLTGGADNQARLWDTRSGKLLGTQPHANVVVAGIFSADERRALTADQDGRTLVWEVETRRTLATLVHNSGLTAALFHPRNPARVFTGTQNGTVWLWELPRPEPLWTAQHGLPVRALIANPHGETLYTASDDRTARAWQAETGQPLGEPMHHRGPVQSLALTPNGQTLLTGSADQTARLWDVATGQQIGAPMQHQTGVVAVAFASQGQTVLTAAVSGLLRAWHVSAPPAPLQVFEHATSWALAGEFSRDGKRLLTGTERGAWLWDVTTGKLVAGPLLAEQLVHATVLSPDGRTAALVGDNQQVYLWEIPEGTKARAVLEHPHRLLAAAFSLDGQQLLVATEKQLHEWDVQTGKARDEGLAWPPDVQAVAFSLAADRAYLGIWERHSETWDLTRRAQIGPMMLHASRPSLLAASRDGTRVAIGTDDRTARVWNPIEGQPLGPPLYHASTLDQLALSPDGQTVLTVSEGKRVRLWNPIQGQPLGPTLILSETVQAARFTPDSASFITVGPDNLVRHWPGPKPLEGEASRVVLTLEVLTGMSLDEGGVLHVLDPDTWRERRRLLQERGGPLLP